MRVFLLILNQFYKHLATREKQRTKQQHFTLLMFAEISYSHYGHFEIFWILNSLNGNGGGAHETTPRRKIQPRYLGNDIVMTSRVKL